MNALPRVLYVCHNHPAHRPGGAEVYAHELFQSVRDARVFEPTFVAKAGTPFSSDDAHPGTRFAPVDGAGDEYLLYTSQREFDRLMGTLRDKQAYIKDWRRFLEVLRPDVVHFQHTLYLGYDILRATRAVLPQSPIVYTLHEFLAICHHGGQMVRTNMRELCHQASPRRCHGCFPGISPQTFLLRERFIKSAFELVDLFIVPSAHARSRYVDWGIPAAKIIHEDYGRVTVTPVPDPPGAGTRRRLAFIGQMTPYKGVDVLLEAIRLLAHDGEDVELHLHGGNLRFQPPAFQEKVMRLLNETAPNVSFTGAYVQSQLPRLLSNVDWVVVPSIWWETGPLVIYEALMHHRPVICSDIGAMRERIQHEANGLLFRAGDPTSLAAEIRRGVNSPALWDRLRGKTSNPHPMDRHLERIHGIYVDLMSASRRSGGLAPHAPDRVAAAKL
jgi:glycosyltransferase involved in cell wall biosynthesis